MDAGQVQNLRRIQIADAGHRPLIEQRHLHRPLAAAEPRRETTRPSSRAHPAPVSPARTPLRTLPAKTGEHFPARGGPNTEARALPLPESVQRNRKCSRLGGSATSTRPVIRGSSTIASPESRCTTTRLPTRPTSRITRPTARRRNRSIRGAIAIGRRRQATRSTSSNPRTDDAQNAPPHRFDFRQFRHDYSPQRTQRTRRTINDETKHWTDCIQRSIRHLSNRCLIFFSVPSVSSVVNPSALDSEAHALPRINRGELSST